MSEIVRLGLIQGSCGEDRRANLEEAVSMVREAARREARLVCLQELFDSPYFCRKEDFDRFNLAEPIPGPSTARLAQLAAELDIVLVSSLFEKRAPGVYHNTAAVMDGARGIVGMYRKMHIPDDPGYYEKFYFTPGDLGFRSHSVSCGEIGVLICWDQWFPEAARLTALAGAQIMLYPTAIGWLEGEAEAVKQDQHAAWETVQRGHAIANGVFVAAVNRVGAEGELTFWGQSFVADPFGRVVAKASADRKEVLVADCDLSLIEQTRRHWPFLRDRRIDAYAGISFHAVRLAEAGGAPSA